MEKKKKLIQIIKNDRQKLNYFIKKMSEDENPSKYFQELINEDFFNPENNPKPIVNEETGGTSFPRWPILDYLEFVALENKKNPNNKVTEMILNIVNSIIDNRNDNYFIDWEMVKILSLLPEGKITSKHIKFFRDALQTKFRFSLIIDDITKSIIPKFLKEKEKKLLLDLTKKIVDYKLIKKKEGYSYISLFENLYFLKAFNSRKEKISDICGKEVLEYGIEKIKEILNIDDNQFSKWKINSINSVENDLLMSNEFSPQIICLAKDMIECLNPFYLENKIPELIDEKYPIFKRLRLFAIKVHYKELNSLFWNWSGNPLDSSSDFLRLEAYELLEKNAKEIVNNKDHLKKIIEWIESADYYLSNDMKNDEEKKKKYIAYKKKEWLSALLKTENKKIKEKYDKYNKIYDAVIDHPGHDIWIDTYSGVRSPIEDQDFIEMGVEKTIEFIKEFHSDSMKYKDPQPEGLSRVLGEFVTNNPDFFINHLDKVLELKLIYLSNIIWGYYEAWRNRKYFDCGKIFDFLERLIKLEKVENKEKNIANIDYKMSAYNAILHLLEEGMISDANAFDKIYLPNSERIIFSLLKEVKSGSAILSETSIVNRVINSILGNLLSCMVQYSLRRARVHKELKDTEDKFSKNVKDHFDKILEKDPEKIPWEYYATWGRYFQNLMHLNKKWAIKNINKIFCISNKEKWNDAISSFFESSTKVFKEIYLLFKEEGIFKRVISDQFEEEIVVIKATQQIVIGYIEEWENLEEDSLISILLKNENPVQINEIVRFILSAYSEKKDDKRIDKLWKEIITLCENKREDEIFKGISAGLWEWIKLFSTIDDEKVKRIKFSLSYFEKESGYHRPRLISYLKEKFKEFPEQVIGIFDDMTEKNILPRRDENDIKYLIEEIYKKKKKTIADNICNRYAEAGMIEKVRTIYDKYNKKNE